jgi:para-nitrobenzyl esterase
MQLPISRRKFIANASLAAVALRCAPLSAFAGTTPVTVSTPTGVLRGEQTEGVRQYRGVPFAEPPVGPLRFRAPVPVKPWSGERDATKFAAAAMQAGESAIHHSEDCLYLNIWAPSGKGPFPVYVWIHGGGFTGGYAFESMFDGMEITKEGIICISVAYRLGVFGFLDLEPLLGPEYAGSANNALKDLIAALEWIQKNISAFGGDPGRVTIGGESAGAKLIDILMGVPSAKSLFHQMISESGGAERVWTKAQSKTVTHGFGDEWHTLTGTDPSTIATADADQLIRAQRIFMGAWPQHFPLRCQIDGNLVPLRPVESIGAGSSRGKRLLIGTNRDESSLFIGPHPQKDPLAGDLGNLPAEKFLPIYKNYRQVYPQMTDEQLRIHAVTAEEYWVPSLRVADAHVKGSGSAAGGASSSGAGANAWMYRLDFSETSGFLKGYAFHSLDVRLVWNRPSLLAENAIAEAQLAKQMFQAWIAFVHGRAPAAQGLPDWPAYNSTTRPTMIFDTQCHVELKPQETELRLWDGVL